MDDLAGLVERAERRRGPRALTREELAALPALYRRAIGELAEARARGFPRESLVGLEALVARAHGILYAPTPARLLPRLAMLMASFPRTVRRSWRLVALAAALLAAGAFWGWLEVQRDVGAAYALLPDALQINAEEAFSGPERTASGGSPLLGVFYFTNNARVAFLCFALGAAFAVGTVVVLLFNGVLLGATIALVSQIGDPRALAAFVAPHGGLEFFAIVVASGGGLRMGLGLLRPGALRRRDALRHAAHEALPLALGAAALLAVAGVVEGTVSPSTLSPSAKLWFGAGLDAALVAYLVTMNRWPHGGREATAGGAPSPPGSG